MHTVQHIISAAGGQGLKDTYIKEVFICKEYLYACIYRLSWQCNTNILGLVNINSALLHNAALILG